MGPNARMKTWLLALAPWMVVASVSAQSDGTWPAEVVFTHYGKVATHAWQMGQDCYVPVDSARKWGWKAKLEKFNVALSVDGRTISLPFRNQAGRPVFNLGLAARKLGAGGSWIEGSRTFEVWAVVREVRVQDGLLSVDSTLPVKPRISFLGSPSRIVFDFEGARLDGKAKQELPPNARAAQFEASVVRVVVESDKRPAIPAHQIKPSRTFVLNFNVEPQAAADGEELATPPAAPPANPIPPVQDLGATGQQNDAGSFGGTVEGGEDPLASPTAFATVFAPKLQPLSDSRCVLWFHAQADLISSPQIRRLAPDLIELTLPGAVYEGELESAFESDLVQAATAVQGPASVVFTIRLARPMGLELARDKRVVKLTLIRPKVGDGKLSSKTIVVDAGHGGHDGGARAPDSSAYEKNMTLAIAKELSDALVAEGAAVIMTRKTDVFIPLKERSEIANRTSADFFLSIHINSSRSVNSSTGGITFYHQRDPIGQLLAECIQAEIAKVSKLKNLGAWSDGRIYDTGFAVLRYAQMPSVLIEMGFINHSGDRRRMLEADFRAKVAEAIVKGLKVYLGNE